MSYCIQRVGVKTDGTMWAWGFNYYGSLGQTKHQHNRWSSPTQVGTFTDWALFGSYPGWN